MTYPNYFKLCNCSGYLCVIYMFNHYSTMNSDLINKVQLIVEYVYIRNNLIKRIDRGDGLELSPIT